MSDNVQFKVNFHLITKNVFSRDVEISFDPYKIFIKKDNYEEKYLLGKTKKGWIEGHSNEELSISDYSSYLEYFTSFLAFKTKSPVSFKITGIEERFAPNQMKATAVVEPLIVNFPLSYYVEKQLVQEVSDDLINNCNGAISKKDEIHVELSLFNSALNAKEPYTKFWYLYLVLAKNFGDRPRINTYLLSLSTIPFLTKSGHGEKVSIFIAIRDHFSHVKATYNERSGGFDLDMEIKNNIDGLITTVWDLINNKLS